jgi:hypothetical protein
LLHLPPFQVIFLHHRCYCCESQIFTGLLSTFEVILAQSERFVIQLLFLKGVYPEVSARAVCFHGLTSLSSEFLFHFEQFLTQVELVEKEFSAIVKLFKGKIFTFTKIIAFTF